MAKKNVTQSEYARLHGVSANTVYAWKKRGWVVLDRNNRVRVDASNANLARYRDARRGANHQRAKLQPRGDAGRPEHVAPEITVEPGETPGDAADRIITATGAEMPYEEARRVKENYLALLNQLDYEIKSGSVVSLDLAKNILFESARAQRDAWLNWPMKVGPLLAADLNAEPDKITDLLTSYVHAQLEELGEPEGNFGTREG